jgi:phenylacetate-CoA ligase
MPEGALWNPEVQTMPRDRLRALQEERLREAVARAYERPFWRRKLERAGLTPDDVKTVEDLIEVPRTVKDELRADQAAHPPFGEYVTTEGAVRVGTSTGTTGEPSMIVWTKRDLAVEHEAAARMFWRVGVRPGWVIAHSHPLGAYGGGALLSSALEHLGCLVLAVGAPATDEQAEQGVRLFQKIRPQMYMMFDAAQLKFWEAAERLGLDPANDLGMMMRMDHPARQYASASAGAECFGYLGGPCETFQGAHICEDYAVVECLDPETGDPIPEGQKGHMVVTTLARDNVMLRYDLEDIIRLDSAECACGETHRRLWWEGRAKELVRIGDARLLPVDVWWALEDFPALKAPTIEFQIVRRTPLEVLEVRVEGDQALGKDIAARIEERLRVPARVEMLPRGTLPRSDFKPVRVVDE